MSSSQLREHFKALSKSAEIYFDEAGGAVTEKEIKTHAFMPHLVEANYYWDQLSDELKSQARTITNEVLPLCAQLAELTRTSVLTGPEDTQDIKFATKAIRAAIHLRKFDYRNIEVLHDEGMVLGVKPAEQSEELGLHPNQAFNEFDQQMSKVASVLKLIDAAPTTEVLSQKIVEDAHKYRTGTAFIMMWMDPDNPELSDIVDAVKEVFQRFKIRAVRADDIEHEGQITQRILDEIRTAEFLFADLTGTRPNVYYETGYAHALGKRVIMFRKSGTDIHFDLAGYNCPEYKNLRDLKDKLTKRLEHLTNKKPTEIDKI